MYRGLNIETLGISGRQSELIELALTYRFKGMDLDMETFARQADQRGQEHAARFIDSAGIHISTWDLPVRWQGDEATYKQDLQKLPAIANIAASINATRCVTDVMPGSDTLPLQENFEFHRERLTEIAELLAPHNISLGIGFQAATASREGLTHQFIVEAEALVTLMKMVTAENVGICLDTWNWHLGGGTVDQVETLTAEKIVAVRAADVPAGATADSVTLAQRALPSPTGVAPVADILTKLSDMEYDGPVIPYPDVSLFKGVTRDKIVQQVADALRSVWPGREITEEEEAEAEAEAATAGADQNGAADSGKKSAATP